MSASATSRPAPAMPRVLGVGDRIELGDTLVVIEAVGSGGTTAGI